MRISFTVSLIMIGLVSGCAGLQQTSRGAQKEFTSDFVVPGKSQNDLWKSARDYFAEIYGDSRSVFRVQDEKDGTLIGRGLAPWVIAGK